MHHSDAFYEENVLDNISPANLSDIDTDSVGHYSGNHSTPVHPPTHSFQSMDHSNGATPVRPRQVHARYPPYYPSHSQNFVFPDVQPARCSSTEKLLSSVIESQKKVMASVEGVSCCISELEKVVTSMNSKNEGATNCTEEKKGSLLSCQ